jgi:quinol monooxygenase YgiN
MDRIRFIATFANIPDGNLSEFKTAAAQTLELAKGEAGTLQYEWFLNEDESACVVYEEYEDSAAVLAHVDNCAAPLGTLDEVGGDCKMQVLGNPTPELREATAGPGTSVFPYHFQGK